MQKEIPDERLEHKVIILPAMTTPVDNKQVFYLFSLQQVEDVQKEMTIYPVPFSPMFVEGITVWREIALPVISLERYLGMECVPSIAGQRFTVIRSTVMTHDGTVEIRSAFRTERGIKMIPVPDSSKPINPNGWIDHEKVKGVFEWDDGFIVVPETEKIIQEEIRSA